MVPIIPLTKEHTPLDSPPDGICYLVAKSGIYKQVRNHFYTARLKVDGIGHLEDTQESVALSLPKLPAGLLQEAEAFFLAAYEKYASEAVALLLANPQAREWRLAIPTQRVTTSGLHVEYDPVTIEVPEGFQPFGTIHSHAGAHAFHSGTDTADEACSDGLHITIGNLDQPSRSYVARWMLHGKAFPVQLADVVETSPLPHVPPEWLAQITPAAPLPHDPFAENWGLGAGTTPDLPDDEIPPALLPEYEEFMAEAHERFMRSAQLNHQAHS